MQKDIQSSVLEAFISAHDCKGNLYPNSTRSAFFVSNLAENLGEMVGGEPLVQTISPDGHRSAGEWMLDIAVVRKKDIATDYKHRTASIVEKILVAVESEFSTCIADFAIDFAKLLNVRAEICLYVCGLNQQTVRARNLYIEAQVDLAKKLVKSSGIGVPFFLAFVPTPGKVGNLESLWDAHNADELCDWIYVIDLSY